MIHIYCGDGKGKTTAAVGLSVRAAGAGKRVVFAQFFKSGESSEIGSLRQLENIVTLHCGAVRKRFARMTDAEKAQAGEAHRAFFREIVEAAKGADLVVFDEILSALRRGTVPEEMVLAFLKEKPEALEVVLTGRGPTEALLEAADYVTEMRKVKHPFDQGIAAREGIEF